MNIGGLEGHFMALSNSTNEFSRYKVHLLMVLMGVAVWLIIGWGDWREGENRVGNSGRDAAIMSNFSEVAPSGSSGSVWTGYGEVYQASEVETGRSFWAEGGLSEVEGRDDAGLLQRENDALRRENFRLKERLDGKTGSGGKGRAQKASYPSSESEMLEEELIVKQEEIDILLLEKEQLEEELDEIVGIATLLQEEVEKVELEGEGLSVEDFLLLQGEIDKYQRENEKLEDRIEELVVTIEYLEDKLAGMAPEGIAVIAPSEETFEIAEQIMIRLGQEELAPKLATRVLVVVYSDLVNPLSYSYGLYGDLVIEANQQTDVKSSMFHAYIYQINDDLSVNQIEHTTAYN